MRKPVQNIGASVRARLLNLAKQRNQPFELMLIRYTLERFLYRLSTSKHRERFALKGAMLMRHWLDDPHRPTRDLDLLGFGDSDPELTLKIFREICAVNADDAVVFDVDGLVVDRVRDESGYSGLRLKTYATVDGARGRVVIDIGYGDATEPGLNDIELPVLLDQPAPNLRAYPYETVIAEKFQAMVALGLANSRLKDFYDIWILAQTCDFKDDRLAQAIAATFARRGHRGQWHGVRELKQLLPDIRTIFIRIVRHRSNDLEQCFQHQLSGHIAGDVARRRCFFVLCH